MGLAMNPAESPLGRGDVLVRNRNFLHDDTGALVFFTEGEDVRFPFRRV